MQILPTDRDLLKAQIELPEKLRSIAVRLRFSRAVPRRMVGDFMRIQLTRGMLEAGEDEFWMAEVYQPDRARVGKCPACDKKQIPITSAIRKCDNPKCDIAGKPIRTGPVRGVVKVVVTDDDVIDREVKKVESKSKLFGTTQAFDDINEWIISCVLMLDRRYPDKTIASVVRTADKVCQEYGWGSVK